MTESTAMEALVENILGTRFDAFPRENVEGAFNRIVDVVGCAIGGSGAAGNSELVKLVKGWGGKREATILVYGGKVPAHNAAMVNSIMARSFDFEALNPLIDGVKVPAHISGTTVMTALTVAEMTKCSGKEFLTALILGDDTAIRILGASGFKLAGGWCNTGTVNQFGATAVAGRLLGLNARQLRNAFGLLLSQIAGSLQNVWEGTTAFKLPQGLSARNGIFSAQLAKAGWTAPADALQSQFGYFKLYMAGCNNPDSLTRGLGKTFYAESDFKPYPCCRGTHASIDCALALVNKYHIESRDIQEAVIYLPKTEAEAFMGQPFRIGEFPQANASFSCRYTTAIALKNGSVRPEHFSEESIRDHETMALVQKIQVEALPGARELTARLVVKMKDGRELSESNDAPFGDSLRNPMTKKDIIDKYYANIAFSKSLNKDRARELLDALYNLEKAESLNNIIALMVA